MSIFRSATFTPTPTRRYTALSSGSIFTVYIYLRHQNTCPKINRDGQDWSRWNGISMASVPDKCTTCAQKPDIYRTESAAVVTGSVFMQRQRL